MYLHRQAACVLCRSGSIWRKLRTHVRLGSPQGCSGEICQILVAADHLAPFHLYLLTAFQPSFLQLEVASIPTALGKASRVAQLTRLLAGELIGIFQVIPFGELLVWVLRHAQDVCTFSECF